MREELLPYYNRELDYIRNLAWQFAEKHRGVADQLLLERDRCDDPHVERLIEAVALLTARIQLRLDDGFSEITDAFLGATYPHFLAPLPACTIIKMELDPEWSRDGEGLRVDRGTPMHTRPTDGVRCRFRTTAPRTLWPLEVLSADVISLRENESGCPPGARGAIRLTLKGSSGRPIGTTGADSLQFYIAGNDLTRRRIYELLFRNPMGVLVREPVGGARHVADFLEPSHLAPGGFEENEALFPHPPGARRAYSLLTEYFAFPEKFLFAHFEGVKQAVSRIESDRVEILVLLDHLPLDLQLSADNFRLGCVPAVNLFEHLAEPIALKRTQYEYEVVPDVNARDKFEVYSVEEVLSSASRGKSAKEYLPIYRLDHRTKAENAAFWHAVRRPSSQAGGSLTEVYLSLVDRQFHPGESSDAETLSVRCLCSNGDMPVGLTTIVEAPGVFQVEGKPSIRSVTCIRRPTQVIRPKASGEGRWKLISHLTLNHLSLADSSPSRSNGSSGDPGYSTDTPRALAALREILGLYDLERSATVGQWISGVVGVSARPVLRRVTYASGEAVHARGLEVRIKLDESRFDGGEFLFASILERFLGLYTTVNSFVQTVVETAQREGVLKKWPPRAGARQIL